MSDALERLGFIAKAVRCGSDSLKSVPLPAIAHVIAGNKLLHYVVIYRFGQNKIHIMNPAGGNTERWSYEQFNQAWTGILILVTPASEFSCESEKSSLFSRFAELVKPQRALILQSLFAAVLYSILGLSTSIYVQKLIDHVIPSGNITLLNLLSLIMILIIAFRVSLGFLKGIFMLKTGQQTDAILISGYFRHLMKLPLRFFETMKTGEILSRVNDAVKIRSLVNQSAVEILVSTMISGFTFVCMFLISPIMAFQMSLMIPALWLVYSLYNRFNKKYLRLTMEQSAELESQLVESINSSSTIRRFDTGIRETEKFSDRFIPLLKTSYTANKGGILTASAVEIITGMFLILILWSGSNQIFKQNITPGEMMSFYALFGYMLGPLGSLIQSNRIIQDALIAADRLFQILDLEQENEKKEMHHLQPDDFQVIRMKDAVFRYGSGRLILKGVSLEIQKGFITGISGDSGSGKSTILNIIQGLYTLNGGSIRFGEFDIGMISKRSISKNIASVTQKIDVFNGTLAENIALGDYRPDMGRINAICADAGLSEIIDSLPAGLNTHLGDNGIRLSGGEYQKMGIARALYVDPGLYLFDEPTSAMDRKSEESFKSLLCKLKSKGKTILLVSHRKSTLEICDIIFKIEEGKVVNHSPVILSGVGG